MSKIQGDPSKRNVQGAKFETTDGYAGVRGYVPQFIKVPIPSAILGSAAEQNTGYTFPAKCAVLDCFLDVTTAEATAAAKTVSVGTDGAGSNDPDGFLAAASVAAAGLVPGELVSTGQTKGALLREDESGAGALVPKLDLTSGGEALTITPAGADFAELAGFICLVLVDLS